MSDDYFGLEWDLAHIAAHTAHTDGFLSDLIELADDGFRSVVGLLLNGMVVIGTIAPSEAVAEELDRERRRFADSIRATPPDDRSKEEWEKDLELFATGNTRDVAEIGKEREELQEEIEASSEDAWDYSSQPQDLARKAFDLEVRPYLSLIDAQIVAPGQSGVVRPKVLRVAIQQIAGWWPVPLDEEGHARFQLFSTGES